MSALRWYQIEAINSIYKYFEHNTGNPVIAMPTGTGKSHVISGFVESVLRQWPYQRILISTHVKELIQQDYNKLIDAWPLAPAGIYSAGLGQKDTHFPITFGGIASIVRNVEAFGHIDLFIVDEGHLVSDNDSSMYQQVIAKLRARNPKLKVICLSATIFRLGMGLLTQGKIFTDICYDLTGVEPFNRLIAEGYLVPLIPKRTKTTLDVSNVGLQQGEYNQAQLQRAVDKEEVTYAALKESMEIAHDRKSWLCFATGIDHTEHVARMLNALGISATFVHSKIAADERDKRIKLFKDGLVRAMVNNNILTTGFDYPGIDYIMVLRPTLSPVLWVQMLGRGTRPKPGFKDNCLVGDFAGNTRRLGPINDPRIPNPKDKTKGVAPIKVCEVCGTYNHISVRYCVGCGTEFNFAVKIEGSAATDALIKADLPVVETFDVHHVVYNRHLKEGSFPVIQVQYHVHGRKKPIVEWVCLEHSGVIGKKARDWWRKRHFSEPPETTDAALQLQSQLRLPKRIRVHTNLKYPEVLGYEW
jgi:DNA repair protein RadD